MSNSSGLTFEQVAKKYGYENLCKAQIDLPIKAMFLCQRLKADNFQQPRKHRTHIYKGDYNGTRVVISWIEVVKHG